MTALSICLKYQRPPQQNILSSIVSTPRAMPNAACVTPQLTPFISPHGRRFLLHPQLLPVFAPPTEPLPHPQLFPVFVPPTEPQPQLLLPVLAPPTDPHPQPQLLPVLAPPTELRLHPHPFPVFVPPTEPLPHPQLLLFPVFTPPTEPRLHPQLSHQGERLFIFADCTAECLLLHPQAILILRLIYSHSIFGLK